jgi:ferredoxin-NADP reductase
MWRTSTLVDERAESAAARTLMFYVPGWPGHLAGQHVDVRLTAEDGYSTQRSYSIASATNGELIELTVQRVSDGEVSPYLVDQLAPRDQVEMRGPVGGWFVWRPEQVEPVMLIAGGSGLVPLMSMIRARRTRADHARFSLLYSVRTPEDQLYQSELRRDDPGLDVTNLYTRRAPESSPRPAGRLMSGDVTRWGWPPADEPTIYICGPTGFVEAAANLFVDFGHETERIRTERFGPSGG